MKWFLDIAKHRVHRDEPERIEMKTLELAEKIKLR